MSIMDKLKKNSKVKESSILSESKFFTEKDMVKIINRDDAEDAEEEKRLNAKNIDGSKQIQGNV